MTDTPNLALPQIVAAQAMKHVTHNEALALLDALVQLSVISRTAAAPSATPTSGDRYLVPAGATGAFVGRAQQVALFDAGQWRFLPPQTGWLAFVADEASAYIYTGSAWVSLGQAIGAINQVAALGIATASDATNKLALRAQGALFTAQRIAAGGTGDMRLTLEKEAAARTGSVLFQSNYSGRAELGLTGDDDIRLKVSADGTLWRDAVQVNRSTGIVSFPNGISGGGTSGMELVQDIAVSASPANIDITALPAAYGSFLLAFNGLAPATDDVSLLMRVQTGGSVWQVSGYDYVNFLIGQNGTIHYTATSEASTTRMGITRSGVGSGVGNAAGRCVNGQISFSPAASSQQRMFDMSATYIRSDGALQKVNGGLSYAASTAVTGLRLFWSAGAFANTGNVRLYGLRKA
jgi:hypothetical protein